MLGKPQYKAIEREADFRSYTPKELRIALQEAKTFGELIDIISTHLDLLKWAHPESIKDKRRALGEAIKAWGASAPGVPADRAWSTIQIRIDELLNLFRWRGQERNVSANVNIPDDEW